MEPLTLWLWLDRLLGPVTAMDGSPELSATALWRHVVKRSAGPGGAVAVTVACSRRCRRGVEAKLNIVQPKPD